MSFSFRSLIILAGLAIALSPTTTFGQGKVYLVVGSYTAIWDGLDISRQHCHFLPDLYTNPQRNAYRVMDPAFRNRFVDSYGNPLKMSWWMLVGSVHLASDNIDVPVPNLMPLHLMMKYQGDAMRQLGDEVSLHYHTFYWSDYDHDGKYFWNEARTFHESHPDFDLTVAQAFLEEGVFPVSFRSGWHYMDNEWQARLNELLPFSLHNDSPHIGIDGVEPLENNLDWSKAPLTFIPYHPSTTNYQLPGDGPGWNVRSVKMQNMTQGMMNQMFAAAAAGDDQLVCIWAHLPEPDFLTNIEKIDTLAHVAATNQPGAKFRYCTAIEAMQRWLHTTDQTPPQLDVTATEQNGLITLAIRTSEPIFQPSPVVAIKDIWEQYRLLKCAVAGLNAWSVTLPLPKVELAKVGIAVTDPAGNLTTKILRYLPDDLYLDNLDPQYSELLGKWIATTNAAWGTDARIALLGPNESARVRWALPVTRSGPYRVLIQVPAVTNAAKNISFSFFADGQQSGFTLLNQGLPQGQWVFIGTPFLSATGSNALDVVFTPGLGQSNAIAVADVLRVTPLLPGRPFISDVQVEPADTTTCITWRTLAPTTSSLHLGLDQNFESFSKTNSTRVSTHVATITDLAPDTTYYFRIEANQDGATYLEPGSFMTTNYTRSHLLFDLTNAWKFTAQNLDGLHWNARDYDDSGWSAGPGLLWVDSRGGTSSTVKSRNTEITINSVTGFPFPTYYFRTHFAWTGDRTNTSLIFSNFIDDGAVFYLNGSEIHRLNMAPSPAAIANASLASSYNCAGDATCAVLFNIAGNLLTNLLTGDNTLAVEVHNYSAKSPDITFGCALFASETFKPLPELHVLQSEENVTVFWNGSDTTLQWADRLSTSMTPWRDAPGAATSSPYSITNKGDAFYRLRK